MRSRTELGHRSWPLVHVAIDGARLALVDLPGRATGAVEREAVLCLHGYLGSHRSWRFLLDPLAERRRVIAPDWFGWGASERPLGMRYLYHLEVERIRELLDRLGVERCTLLGHDYGGHIGLGFCLRYPERVASLAIINSRAHGTFRAPWYAIFEAISRAARTGIGARLFEWMPLEAIHRIVVAREVERGIIDARSLDSYAGWMGRDRHAGRFLAEFFADYSCAVRPDLVEGLSEIACPTAVIWGREDRFLDERIARELASGIEGAELVWLEGAGHFSLEERPGEVLGALRV